MKRYRIHLISGLIIALGAVAIISMVQMFLSPSDSVVIVERTSSPAKSAFPMIQSTYRSPFAPTVYSHPSENSTLATPTSPAPVAGLWKTSSAKVTVINSAGIGNTSYTQSSSSSSQRGIGSSFVSSVAPVTSFVAMANTREIASPGATEAPQMAEIQSAPRRGPGPPDIIDLPTDEQLPVGSPLCLVALVFCYTIYLFLQKNRVKHEKNL